MEELKVDKAQFLKSICFGLKISVDEEKIKGGIHAML
jgi:hypothetical protein